MNGSAVSKTLIVGGAGESVYVYDAATEELLGKLDGSSDVKSVTIFEKGADERSGLIGAAYKDGTIKVWDAGASALTPPTLSPYLTAPLPAAASLELKAEKQSAHSDYVRSVAFSPDGKTIVSGSDDKTIKVWDAVCRH